MVDFTGDLGEQKVELPLEKFTKLVQDNHDLEVLLQDVNPWQKWVHFAHTLDAYRVFPRIFITMYIVLTFYSGWWFMGLAAPVATQSTYIATIIGAGAAWFGLYVNSGWKHGKQ